LPGGAGVPPRFLRRATARAFGLLPGVPFRHGQYGAASRGYPPREGNGFPPPAVVPTLQEYPPGLRHGPPGTDQWLLRRAAVRAAGEGAARQRASLQSPSRFVQRGDGGVPVLLGGLRDAPSWVARGGTFACPFP